jgi:hypothetical protein
MKRISNLSPNLLRGNVTYGKVKEISSKSKEGKARYLMIIAAFSPHKFISMII